MGSRRDARRIAAFTVAVAAALLCGCRSGGRTASGGGGGGGNLVQRVFGGGQPCAPEERDVVTRVGSGDVIRGHLYPDQGCQCFFFEGVESTLLDFELATDVGNQAAPNVEISAPDGKVLTIRPALGPEGSACQRAKGIVLPRTGTYRVSICKAPCEPEHYWRFEHSVRCAPPADMSMHLTACAPQPVSFTAPYGSRVTVRVAPESKCGVVPTVVSVKDPDGARALDVASVPNGPPAAKIGRSDDGTMVLDFYAVKPGRYTVLLASEAGTEGSARTTVAVMPPREHKRTLYHGGWPCPEGPPSKPGAPPLNLPVPTSTTVAQR